MGVDYLSLGPNHIYIQHYNNNVLGAVLGLGLAARGVRKRIEPIWEQVQNDAAGQGNVEATFQGMSGVISFDTSIFDPAVVKRCMLPLPNPDLARGLFAFRVNRPIPLQEQKLLPYPPLASVCSGSRH